MCGLLASTGKIEARYVTALGCLSESRGDESAGVAWQVGEAVRVAKIAQNPLVAFPVALAPAIRHASKYGGVLIGHTRQATTGAVNDKNAHPFYDAETKIAWAHNGMIYNHAEFGKFEVDSQALLEGIKTRNFSRYRGPIALLWIENGQLHAFRKGNPLYRGFRNRAVYLASEEKMLAEIGCKRIKEISEARMYVWEGVRLVETKTVPCNKSYSSYTPSIYEEGEAWDDMGKFRGCGSGMMQKVWDYELKAWVYRSDRKVEPMELPHRCHTRCKEDRWDKSRALTRGSKATDLRDAGPAREPDTLAELDSQTTLLPHEICASCQVMRRAEGSAYCVDCYMGGASYRGMGD